MCGDGAAGGIGVQRERQEEETGAVALRVREELARRRLSRQWLADEAKLSLSTLEKALAGQRPFTLATLVRIEEALGVSLRLHAHDTPEQAASPSGLAPDEMGAYTRAGVRWLEGEYLTLRPSFGEKDAVYAYRTLIEWQEEKSCLSFAETARMDSEFQQQGFVSFPHITGHIYLVTIFEGQYRMAMLGRSSVDGALNGILLTLSAGQGAQLIPSATPLTLVPMRRRPGSEFGLLRPGDACYDEYRALVDRVTARGFALFPC
jgi:transcriptional regulator with XRE-family HTH domain